MARTKQESRVLKTFAEILEGRARGAIKRRETVAARILKEFGVGGRPKSKSKLSQKCQEERRARVTAAALKKAAKELSKAMVKDVSNAPTKKRKTTTFYITDPLSTIR